MEVSKPGRVGRGEVEAGETDRRYGESRMFRVVEDVEYAGGDGGEEEERENCYESIDEGKAAAFSTGT